MLGRGATNACESKFHAPTAARQTAALRIGNIVAEAWEACPMQGAGTGSSLDRIAGQKLETKWPEPKMA